MDTGEISSRALVRGYLGRIDMVDPRLNAVVEVNPDAMTIT
jgi:amidase